MPNSSLSGRAQLEGVPQLFIGEKYSAGATRQSTTVDGFGSQLVLDPLVVLRRPANGQLRKLGPSRRRTFHRAPWRSERSLKARYPYAICGMHAIHPTQVRELQSHSPELGIMENALPAKSI